MSEPRRWTIHVCPYCGEQVYSDGWFPCGHDETRFCLEHPEYEQEVDASGAHTSFVGGEEVPARSLVPREVEVVEAALPDDQEQAQRALKAFEGDGIYFPKGYEPDPIRGTRIDGGHKVIWLTSRAHITGPFVLGRGWKVLPDLSAAEKEQNLPLSDLPDDQLREKVAEAIDGAWTREVVGRVAHLQVATDAAIEAMRGVSAAPAPPEPLEEWRSRVFRALVDADAEARANQTETDWWHLADAVLAAVGPKEERDG